MNRLLWKYVATLFRIRLTNFTKFSSLIYIIITLTKFRNIDNPVKITENITIKSENDLATSVGEERRKKKKS